MKFHLRYFQSSRYKTHNLNILNILLQTEILLLFQMV
jgi:hypothetical protein